MTQFIDTLVGIFQSSGFAKFGEPGGYLYAVMICVGCFLLYLAIVKEFEPLILLPMAFGMILANLPGSGVIHMQYFVGDGLEHPMWVEILNNGGLADMLYMGVKLGIYPPLIFLGIGTMTDFAPLISNPKSLLLGAAAQFGIFGTYMGARLLTATGLVDFTQKQSAAIAIIGGADGPTAIFVTSRLAPELLGSIAVAAYSYMALVPVIQPPIMKALTTKKERTVVMKQLRTVSKTERIIFPIMVTIIVSLIVPDAAVLVGMLMLGNLMKECGVVDRIQKTAGNELMNIITIFLALSVGCTTSANTFLNTRTLFIIVLGLIAFSFGTAAGVLFGKLDVCADRRSGEPPDRFRRRFRCAYGRSRFPEGRPEREPLQLPADARHGPQRGRRYRLCRCCWYPDQHFRLSAFLKNIFSARRFARAAGRFLFYDLKCPPRLLWA